jgi:cytochrome c2
MRKVKLKHATSAVIGILGVAIILLAGIRTFVTGEASFTRGSQLFNEDGCIQCHFPDSRKKKIGPGLEGLFDRKILHKSGWPVTEENVRQQIIDPYESMPSFRDKLSKQEIDTILEYLKTL